MAMGQHVPSRVRKVRLTPHEALHALFEAVANSIDAIETSGVGATVTINVIRDADKPVLATKKEKIGRHPLMGFRVTDDGPGFDELNYKCFGMADLTHKSDRGAKGEGRFSWLKVFDCVDVASVYETDQKKVLRRVSLFRKRGRRWAAQRSRYRPAPANNRSTRKAASLIRQKP